MNVLTTASLKQRDFIVAILKDKKNRYLVRKSEIIHGITVLLFETSALNLEDAVKIQQYLVNEIHKYRLN